MTVLKRAIGLAIGSPACEANRGPSALQADANGVMRGMAAVGADGRGRGIGVLGVAHGLSFRGVRSMSGTAVVGEGSAWNYMGQEQDEGGGSMTKRALSSQDLPQSLATHTVCCALFWGTGLRDSLSLN